MTCNSISGKEFCKKKKKRKKRKKERKYENVDKKLDVDTPRGKYSKADLELSVKHVR